MKMNVQEMAWLVLQTMPRSPNMRSLVRQWRACPVRSVAWLKLQRRLRIWLECRNHPAWLGAQGLWIRLSLHELPSPSRPPASTWPTQQPTSSRYLIFSWHLCWRWPSLGMWCPFTSFLNFPFTFLYYFHFHIYYIFLVYHSSFCFVYFPFSFFTFNLLSLFLSSRATGFHSVMQLWLV